MPRRGKGFRILLGLDATSLRRGFQRARAEVGAFGRTLTKDGAAKLRVFSRSAERSGRVLTRSITLPLVAAAAAAAKLALDYQSGLTKVGTLTGLAQVEVRKLGDALKDVSAESKVAVDELTGALLVAVSAGFRGQEALEITASAAKLVRLGFGELDVVTRALTVTVENYGASGLSAARASDILLATAQQGNFEVSQLGDVFGRMLAVSNSLGISIEEISSNFAALTRATGSATESQTQLSGILIQLVKPAESARAAYAAIGTSIEEVRAQLGDEGLHATLVSIVRRLRDAGIDISKVFGRAQAIQGVTALTSAASTVPAILEEISASTGQVNQQFSTWAKTSEGELKGALADTKNAAIELGEQILPVVASALGDISGAITGASDAFNDMTPATRKAILSIVALTAAAPVAALGAAKLAKGILAVRAAFISMNLAALGPVGLIAAVGAAAAGFFAFRSTLNDSAPTFVSTLGFVDNLTRAFERQDAALQATSQTLQEYLQTPAGNREAIDIVEADLATLLKTLEAAAQESGDFEIFGPNVVLPAIAELSSLGFSDEQIKANIGSLKTRVDDELAKVGGGIIDGDKIFANLFGFFRVEGKNLLDLPSFQAVLTELAEGLATIPSINAKGPRAAAQRAEERAALVQRAQEQIDAFETAYLGESTRLADLQKSVEEVLPGLFDAFDDDGDELLRNIRDAAEASGDWRTAINDIIALADARYIDIAAAEDQIDAMQKQSNGLRELVKNMNAARQATERVIVAQTTLRNSLGLDQQVLEDEEALQALFTSQAEAAFLTLGNTISVDRSGGLLDEYNAATIDAIQAWFADIDRYARSLGSGGKFSALDQLIGEQLSQLAALEDSLPESTYRRLVDRLRDIKRSALDPDGTVGGTAAVDPVQTAFEQGVAEAEAFVAGYRISINILEDNPVLLEIADIDLSQAEAVLDEWRTYLASDAGSLGLNLDPAFLEDLRLVQAAASESLSIDVLIGEIDDLKLQQFYSSIDAASLGIDVDSAGVTSEVDRVIAQIENREAVLQLALNAEDVEAKLARLFADQGFYDNAGGFEGGRPSAPLTNSPPATTSSSSTTPASTRGRSPAQLVASQIEALAARAAVLQARGDALRAQALAGGETRSTMLAREAEERTIQLENAARERTIRELRSSLNLAALARGGIVTRPTISLIGEGGEPEAIVPLSRAQEFGFNDEREAVDQTITININGDFYGDEESFRDLIVDELRTHARLNGVGSIGI